MVVCKFFLQGTCKFGDFCKFEHQLNDNFNNYQNSTSILRQSHFGITQQQIKPTTNPSNVDTNTLVKSVVNDMTVAEKGGQWLLSCYAPFKEKPAFPGFEDQSSEEIRWSYYEAVKNGAIEQYKQQVQMMLQQAVMKMKSLQTPSPDIVNILKCIYNSPPSSYCGVYGTNTVITTGAFNNAGNAAGPFPQQQQSTFGQQPSSSMFPQSNQNVFGNSTQPQSQFGNTSNSVFGGGTPQNQVFPGQPNNSIFGSASPQAQNTGTNIFRQASSNFATPQSTGSIFGGQPTMTSTSGSIFGGNQSSTSHAFGSASNSIFGGQATNSSVFSGQQNSPPTFRPQVQPNTGNIFSNSYATQNPNTTFGQNVFASATNQPFAPATVAQNVPQHASSNIFGMAARQPQAQTAQKPMFAPQQAALFSQQNTGTAFNQQTSNSPFGQSPLSVVDAKSHSNNIFGSSQNTVIPISSFGQVQQQQQQVDGSIYSKLEELTEEEIKWFESDDLDVLKIPEKPPTYQMCFKT